jgi:serine/threonine protein kinase/Flp pilus assembly protein TadD
MIGRVVLHYRIVAELGSGGMGRVYRAEDTLLGRTVALKFPHLDARAEPSSRERLLREARVASVLDHPNIVVVFDVGETDGEVFIAMQCVEGRSLRERLAAGTLPSQEAAATARAIADALAHAHARHVIHRDVKPENVLISTDGRLKVADFGLARSPNETAVTALDVLPGTVAYLAPELLAGRQASPASDLYALGVTLYEMLAGRVPFEAESSLATMYKIVHEEPPALSASVPEGLRRLTASLLSKDPALRPAGAAFVASALTERSSEPAITETTPGRSIAVLSFDNLTGAAEDEYLCSGITEDLLTDILKIPDLDVASRGLVGNRRSGSTDARQAGRDLGVATVLEGGVRRAGTRVRVNARLVRADTGYQLWAERYDRELQDVFEVQEDIARNIAEALRVVFQPDVGRQGRRTASPRAVDLRLRALDLHRRMEDASMRRAIELLEEAVREDPGFALGWADLAEGCIQMVCKVWDPSPSWLERAETLVAKALELAPRLPEAFRARGHLFMHRRNIPLAVQDYQLAIELDPRFAAAHNNLAYSYLVLDDPGRAEVHARRARELDPASPSPHINLGNAVMGQGRPAEAREAARAVFALDVGPLARLSALDLVMISYIWEDDRAGVERTVMEVRSFPESDLVSSILASAAAFLGDRAEAARRLADPGLLESASTYVHLNRARSLARLGDRDGAIAAMRRAFEIEVMAMGDIRGDRLLMELLADSRLDDLRVATSRPS